MKITYLPDNIWARVESPGGALLSQVEHELRFRPKGYTFAPSYKAGHWDGFIKLTRKRGDEYLVPAGLVPYLLDRLGKDYIEVSDCRTVKFNGWLGASPVLLSDAQLKAVDAAIAASRGLLQYPTGTGKGRIMGEIIRRVIGPTSGTAVVLVEKRDLLTQLGREIGSIVGADRVGQVGGGVWMPRKVTIATVQTLNKRLNPTPDDVTELLDCDIVIVDEAHHAEADQFQELLQRCTAYWRFGLSATAFRSYTGKSENFGTFLKTQAFIGPPIAHQTIQAAVDSGRIVAPDIYIIHGCGWPTGRYNFREEYGHGIIANEKRNAVIVGIAGHMPGQTIVLADRIEHGEILAEAITDYTKVDTPFLHGSSVDRADKYQSFKQGYTQRMVLSKIADEALDLPNIDNLILAGGGRAQHRQIQRIGRALRASPGKTSVTVWDFEDYGKYLGSHYRKRLRTYEGEPAYTVVHMEEEDLWDILSIKVTPTP